MKKTNESSNDVTTSFKKIRANSDDKLHFTIFLHPHKKTRALPKLKSLTNLNERNKVIIDRRTYNKKHSSHSAHIQLIEQFAIENNFIILKLNKLERWINVQAKVEDIEKAFRIDIKAVERDSNVYYYFDSEIKIPSALEDIVESISGINRMPIKTSRIFPDETALANTMLTGMAVFPQDYTHLYNFPKGLDGSGQCIAIIALAGGYKKKHFKEYFKKIGIPMPHISWKSVDKGKNNPKDDIKSVYEIYMDVEIAAAMAPGAKIVVYFAQKSANDIMLAMKKALHDRRNRPSIISMSWGGLEKDFKESEKKSLFRVLHEAATLNVTVITSSGDMGSSGTMVGDELNVQLPAVHPLTLAVGGTEVETANGRIMGEKVWNEKQELPVIGPFLFRSGGGFSKELKLPKYQKKAMPDKFINLNKRGIPDVAANASTLPGILLLVGETEQISMGTSAAAPLWAALVARINQHLNSQGLSNCGFLNPYLYSDEVSVTFNSVTKGNIGAYEASEGWDPCTGLGTPNGEKLLLAIEKIKKRELKEF